MHGYLRAFTSETHAQVSETARTGAAAGHSRESDQERRHTTPIHLHIIELVDSILTLYVGMVPTRPSSPVHETALTLQL